MYRLNDLGHSKRFVDLYGSHLRYVHDWKTWMYWIGDRWIYDTTQNSHVLAKTIGEEIRKEAEEYADSDDKGERKLYDQLMRAASRAEEAPMIKKILWMAQSDSRMSTVSNMYDDDPLRVNTPSGTVDLLLGGLDKHRPEDLLTQVTHKEAKFNLEATCPLWLDVLNVLFHGSQELIDYVNRAAGYSLSSKMSEQCLFYCYGTGANGKSIFLNTLKNLMGGYACQAMPGTFDARGAKRSIREDLARLRGKRLVITTEMKKGEPLDAETIKSMTGGDTMVAKNIYEKPFEFDPYFKVWFAANTQMPVPEATHGMWRRLRVIPFTAKIPKEKQENFETLMWKLEREYSGILNWLIEGYAAWCERGLDPPMEVIKATADYQANQDKVGEFIALHCVTGEGLSVTLSDIYARFKQWYEDEWDNFPMGKNTFANELRERDYESDRGYRNAAIHRGIDLKPIVAVVPEPPAENEWDDEKALPF